MFKRILDKLFPPTYVFSRQQQTNTPLETTGKMNRHYGRLVFGVVVPTRDIASKLKAHVYLDFSLWEVFLYTFLGVMFCGWLWSAYPWIFQPGR